MDQNQIADHNIFLLGCSFLFYPLIDCILNRLDALIQPLGFRQKSDIFI